MDELLNIADEEWSPEFLDSIFENNTDLLSVFDDPHKISEITSDLMEYEEHHSPLSSRHSDAADLDAFLLHPSSTLSSSASDSGLSSDNLDFETSPDYEPLSPTLSSPGPSISERGGQNSPPRFQKVAKVSPTVHKKFNTRSSTAAANAAASGMTPVSPRLVQAVQPTPVKAVTGVKRGQASVGGGPKAKEVKVYRVQPTTTTTTTTTAGNKKYNVTPQAQTTMQVTTNNNSKTTGAALSNGVRKMLINTMDVKDLRTIKIINANTLKNAHLKMAAANLLQQSKQGLLPKNAMLAKAEYERGTIKQELVFQDQEEEEENNSSWSNAASSDDQQQFQLMEERYIKAEKQQRSSDADEDDEVDEDSDDEDEYGDRYPSSSAGGRGSQDKLVLTAEEKRLLSKEGITLPSNYPLTKHEERELKRIRRKIRNKISAQDSRKRKKEYVDGLEERVKQCTDDNQSLMKRIKMLQGQNHSLMTQMKKLQSLLSKTNNGNGNGNGNSSSTAQPTTCLMVLLLSMALIAAPNLKLGKRDGSAKESELAEAIQEMQQMQQNRRNLLFNENVNSAEDDEQMEVMNAVCNENDFIVENENFIENFYSRIGVVGGKRGGGGGGQVAPIGSVVASNINKGNKAFLDLDLDDTVWRAKDNKASSATVAAGSSSSFGALPILTSSGGTMGDVMDNFLIMELRNNLLGSHQVQAQADEAAAGGAEDKKINKSMQAVHHQHHHLNQHNLLEGNILFQD